MFASLLCIRVRQEYIIAKLHKEMCKVCLSEAASSSARNSGARSIQQSNIYQKHRLFFYDYMYLVQKFQLWLYPF